MCDENKEEEMKRKKRYKKDVVLMCCDGWDYIIYALGFLVNWVQSKYWTKSISTKKVIWALKVIGLGL
jgi:hypothetical protein